MEHLIDVTLAGLTFSCALRFPGAAVFPRPDPDAPRAGVAPVCLSQEDWEYYCGLGSVPCPQSEFSLLTAPFSDALMGFDRLILHGVALRWRDRAYLICGLSGVGKSTQARFLRELRPSEFGIICGDRPVLSFHDNDILAHPSPWNGKEKWCGAEAAPLAGLILLERGEGNRLVSLTGREASIPVYNQVIQTTAQEKRICQSAALITRLLQTVPIWRLTTYQVPDSTKLLLEGVFSV